MDIPNLSTYLSRSCPFSILASGEPHLQSKPTRPKISIKIPIIQLFWCDFRLKVVKISVCSTYFKVATVGLVDVTLVSMIVGVRCAVRMRNDFLFAMKIME
ncbi:hypothetical protein T02_15685 [Trichinella nativa]|uniref:Uncharacterized protein n=1 Tax=Trichinella nativa TaxID=6335 RepID=A0A0V1KMB4_9BILA|nr:hypothetical protein T02_15685 [Trichinella nativa]